MVRTKIHILIIVSFYINAFAMGMLASKNYHLNNSGYTITFILLCLFFVVLSIYGSLGNRKINRTNK